MARTTENRSVEPGKKTARVALVLSIFVIMLGAFTRLTDAGLGCPDWPGCYGRIAVPLSAEAIEQANTAYPARPVEHAKAWAEMVHRYIAGTLGLMIFYLFAVHWRAKSRHRGFVTALSLLIIAQAALGMWTVTLGLKPIVVTAHLLGGFTTFCLLLILNFRQSQRLLALKPRAQQAQPFRAANPLFVTAFLVLVLQITLGGWTAANYAASVCVDLPICQGDWVSHLNFKEALKLWWTEVEPYRDGTSAYEFGTHITPDVKITIHVMHRIGAWTASLLILLCAAQLWRANRLLASNLLFLLFAQVMLGISNVVLHLPLGVAVAHNLGGLLLLAWMIVIFKWSKQHAIGYKNHDARNSKRATGQVSNIPHSTTA
jgi:cytochrome c oxidase assembly protein subunit 15